MISEGRDHEEVRASQIDSPAQSIRNRSTLKSPPSEARKLQPALTTSTQVARPLSVEKLTKKHKTGLSPQPNAQPPSPQYVRRSSLSPNTPSSSANKVQTTTRNKLAPLYIDIPSVAYRPLSPEQGIRRTPRPELTEKQAERDVSPQMISEHDGIVERDYAQQPKSPAFVEASRSLSPSSHLTSSPTSAKSLTRPTLLTRTLSNYSQTERSPSPQYNMPDSNELLVYNGSVADDAAVKDGTMSMLKEGSTKSFRDGVQELDKGDLQAEVEIGMIEDHTRGKEGRQREELSIVESPEILYEWSPSPEVAGRGNGPMDATLLPPDDPNYIPADIEFPDPEEDLEEDEDDREHVASLTSEQLQYAKFLAELKNKDLDEMEFEVQNELKVLNEQNKRDRKLADDITQQMAKDIQVGQLFIGLLKLLICIGCRQTMLRVLGLPYVVAPMEAEAQCAELLSRSLVDGVITDDNDVFLFGATRVYKNMFNQNKYVECYLASDIDRELALDREKLIRLAHFLGSDYCDGLPGVGPVLGMELMAEFPGANGLVEFRNWWLKIQRGKDTIADHPTAFRRKFKKSRRDIYVDESWPSQEVAKAYLYPQVDDSDEAFAWGIPDLDAMRDFLKDSLGWGPAKVDELMLPIIKRMTGRATGGAVNQSTISNFFDVSGGTGRYAPMSSKGYQSKRLQNVVKAWRQSQQRLAKGEEEGGDDDLQSGRDVELNVGHKPKRPRALSSRSANGRKESSSQSSSSKHSSCRPSSQAGHSSDSEANFHAELEDKLAKMGVKRRREAPIGSDRVIKPAKRSKRDSDKAKKGAKGRTIKETGKTVLSAPNPNQEPVVSSSRTLKSGKRKAKRIVAEDSDEYHGG